MEQFKNYGVVLEKGSVGSSATFNYAIWSYNDRVQGFLANGSGNIGVSYSSSNISLDTWHHVAIVADGTKFRMYLDGQEVASTNQTITPYANTLPLRISYSGYTIDGYIDEVKVYNYARTEEQIRQDIAGTVNPGISSSNILPQPVSH